MGGYFLPDFSSDNVVFGPDTPWPGAMTCWVWPPAREFALVAPRPSGTQTGEDLWEGYTA